MKKESLKFLLANIDKQVDENSIELKNYLTSLNIEKEIVQLPRIHFKSILAQEKRLEKFSEHYYCIDKNIYEKVKIILEENNNSERLNEICLHLKACYYQVYLSRLNAENFETKYKVIKELQGLKKIAAKNISKIKFQTNIKEDTFILDSSATIGYISRIFIEQIDGFFDEINFDEKDEEIKEILFEEPDYHKACKSFINITASDLLKYIKIEGDEDNFIQFIDCSYSKQQLYYTRSLKNRKFCILI